MVPEIASLPEMIEMKKALFVALFLLNLAPIAYAQDNAPPPSTGLPRFERLFEKEGWAQSGSKHRKGGQLFLSQLAFFASLENVAKDSAL